MKSIAAFMLSKGSESDPGYSTEELDTGKKWIDGKPIYRKVIQTSNISFSSNTWTTVIANTINASRVISAMAYDEDHNLYSVAVTVNSSGIQAMQHRNIALTLCEFIFEYTKTDTSNNA